MMKKNILVVAEAKDVLEPVRHDLSKETFSVKIVNGDYEAMKSMRTQPPDVIVIDFMIPRTDWLEFCRGLKGNSKTAKIPIIMLADKKEDHFVISALELGIEEYITKPFHPNVLVTRIGLVAHRKPTKVVDETLALKIDGIEIIPRRNEVRIDGKNANLTSTEYKILNFLARRPGAIFTRQQIIDGVRGASYPATDRSVDVQITGLRRKMGRFCCHIETIRGVGYKFKNY